MEENVFRASVHTRHFFEDTIDQIASLVNDYKNLDRSIVHVEISPIVLYLKRNSFSGLACSLPAISVRSSDGLQDTFPWTATLDHFCVYDVHLTRNANGSPVEGDLEGEEQEEIVGQEPIKITVDCIDSTKTITVSFSPLFIFFFGLIFLMVVGVRGL